MRILIVAYLIDCNYLRNIAMLKILQLFIKCQCLLTIMNFDFLKTGFNDGFKTIKSNNFLLLKNVKRVCLCSSINGRVDYSKQSAIV